MPRITKKRGRIKGTRIPKRVCFIATEDSKTGAVRYFQELQEKFINTHVLKVIPSYGGRSAPKHVFANLKLYHPQERNGDVFWLVCDVDSWNYIEIQKVIKLCTKEKFYHAFSNPCFEIWELYHQPNILGQLADSQACKQAVTDCKLTIGYYNRLMLDSNIEHAITHAKNADVPNKIWPTSQGSHVYKLIELLQNGVI